MTFIYKDDTGTARTVKIHDYHVNPWMPYIEREPSTFEPVRDDEGNIETNEDGSEKTREIEGKIISEEKRYTAILFLKIYFAGDVKNLQLNIDNLKEDECNFKHFYKKLKEMPEYEGAKNA